MHIFSGLKRYDRVRNLKIREFLVVRPDPVAEKQFGYWRAYPRRIERQDRETVLRECLIASRAATPQQIVREELYRVHLAVSLSHHRYEGWVVVAPRDRWAGLDEQTRQKLQAALDRTRAWQRADARQREAAAVVELQQAGMAIYEVDDAEREAFRQPLPDLAELLPDTLNAQTRQALVTLASAGAAAIAGTVSDGAAAQPGRTAAPAADNGESDQAER
jgi:TRAP-type C4-dicarboxylate transport system substrate-binding protein